MGNSTFSSRDWDSHSSSVSSKSTAQVFTSKKMKTTNDPRTSFDPSTIPFRESRDSKANPNSTPIIVALDVTGSMEIIPDYMVKKGLGPAFKEIYDRKPVTDPHIMMMAVGDADYDRAPLQVTQFEADIKLAKQLSDLYLEGGGGGNGQESYTLPWYFAATRTRCDSIEKGRRKGILFTIGDEGLPSKLTAEQIQKAFGGSEKVKDIPVKDLYAMVSKYYDVFHIVVEEGSHYRSDPQGVLKSWRDVLGERVIRLKDHTKLSEVLVSTLQVLGGEDPSAVADSWKSKGTALVVRDAIGGLTPGKGPKKPGLPTKRTGPGGVTRLDPK